MCSREPKDGADEGGTAKQTHWKCPADRIGEHEMEDPNLGWGEPIAQASSLRSAVKKLLALGLGPRERGTGPLEG